MPRLVDNSWGKGGGVIKDPLERKTLGGWEGVQIKEFSMGGGGDGYFLEPPIAAQYKEHGSVEWWLVDCPFFPTVNDKQESKVMQGVLNPLWHKRKIRDVLLAV